jgi:hypothetical protein
MKKIFVSFKISGMPCIQIRFVVASFLSVLPTGRNFGRKTQKWSYKNTSGRLIKKMVEKCLNFLEVCSHKSLHFWQNRLYEFIFITILRQKSLKNRLYERITCAVEFCHVRPNFSVNLAEIVWQASATLIVLPRTEAERHKNDAALQHCTNTWYCLL